VRDAIEAYLVSAKITHLAVLNRQAPKITPEGDIMLDPKTTSKAAGVNVGVVCFMRLSRTRNRQIAWGGAPEDGGSGGRKFKTYEVTFDALLRSTLPDAEDAGDANDDFLDSFEAAIMANRTADSAGAIFQWGMGGETGGVDIEIESFYPQGSAGQGNLVQIVNRIVVQAVEIINA
jgi:hypothetical protein